jgi:hypothetical protein
MSVTLLRIIQLKKVGRIPRKNLGKKLIKKAEDFSKNKYKGDCG